jgi:N-acetylglucosaminyldiphosphoundecaprenol N-acetyl-beta-D-mannosaminyltransferase
MTARGAAAEDWQPRWRQLVDGLVRVDSTDREEQLLDSLSRTGKPLVLAFVNAHAMNSAAASRAFFEAVTSADLLLRDGSGMAILLRLLGLPVGRNLNGTDLIPRILRRYAGRPIALFGTQDPYLARAGDVVRSRLAPGCTCVTAHGFLDTPSYVRLALAHRPGLIVLGMGMPRQEDVARALRGALDFPCLIVCGGAIIDFLGGKIARAPGWMRGLGLEWLFRLAVEPKRLFKRYVIGNPLFIARALSLAAASSRGDRAAT